MTTPASVARCAQRRRGGVLGGLVMSAVKRSLGAKDWGQSIAGHGGYMDRLDSITFAAPVFFHVVRYGWTP
jgi:Predicted CDP-diglyceride synthetase/phosphatidate cytidylyltransferase